jgi:hypothetical protein
MKCFWSGVFNTGPFDYLLMRMISICEVHACNCMQHILCVCMKVDVMLICVYPAFVLYHGITDEEGPCRHDQILSTRLGSHVNFSLLKFCNILTPIYIYIVPI